MTTRRELFPLLAGAAGIAAVANETRADAAASGPELRRITYRSARTGKDRDYFVYLPPGHASKASWPVILFLHGNGERGDGRGELDYVLAHGPLYEAWCLKRDLPFVIISPQLPMFGQGNVDYIKNRTRAQIPQRKPGKPDAREDERGVRLDEPMRGKERIDKLPDGPDGPVDGWNLIEGELLAMVDKSIAEHRGDAKRVYVTGLSYGGFGSWYLGAKHPRKFAAIAPVVGYGHPDQAKPIVDGKLPVWVFAGGRDGVVPAQYFYAALDEMESLGMKDVRFTNHEDLGHFTWTRVYGGNDLYDWFLTKSR